MANKRKRKNQTISNLQFNQENTQQEILTESQVFNVLEMAKEIYSSAYGKGGEYLNFEKYDGTYSPYLTNERLSEIGLTPEKVSKESLCAILENPISNQKALKGYSEYLKFTDTIAKRTLGYLGNLPSFDYTFNCINIENESEYDSKEYKDDIAIVKNFLSRFDVRGQFAYANRRSFEVDAFYAVLRFDGERYAFQELPHNFCKITGRTPSWGFQYDFDMSWFLQMGLSIDSYPRIFRTMYNRVLKGKKMDKYDPSNPLDSRDGTYSMWAQTSSLPDKGNFVCFKYNTDMFSTMPYLTSMFQDSVNKPLIRALQIDQDIIASQKILIGLIPLLKEQKSGQIKDALAVSPQTMGQFLGLLKKGLSNALKITGAPFEDVKQVEFNPPTNNMYNEANSIEAANSGVTSRLIYSSDRMSAAETEYAVGIDELIATSVYPQYETWLSSMVNFFTKKYKFNFKFKGTKFKANRKERIDNCLKLADKGLVDFQEIASAFGEDIFTLEEKVTASSHSPLWGKLKLLLNTNTKYDGSEANSGGRPKSEIVSESRERSNDYVKEDL